jgi:hypothetical protein
MQLRVEKDRRNRVNKENAEGRDKISGNID